MELFFVTGVKILVLLNPCAVLTTYLALTARATPPERRRVILLFAAAVATAGTLLFFGGGILFRLLGIDLDVFRVGGGVILLICAVSMVWGGAGAESRRETAAEGNISVVPLAIPMAVGPGTSAGLIVIGMESAAWELRCINLAAFLLAAAVLALLLAAGERAGRLLGRQGMAVLGKLTGLFLSAIAAKMILDGVRGALFS